MILREVIAVNVRIKKYVEFIILIIAGIIYGLSKNYFDPVNLTV